MIAFLSVFSDIEISQFLEGTRRKLALRTLRFLKAENVGAILPEEAFHKSDAQADRVDVPGCTFQFHPQPLPQANPA
jgi:hypothetical protein